MARTASQVMSGLVTALVSKAAGVGLTINPSRWSKTDYKQLTLNTVADAHVTQEQLYDSVVEDVESKAKTLPYLSYPWIQDKMLNLFQYSATIPQILQLDRSSFVYKYPISNIALNIVKYCAVVRGTFGTTLIKIAGISGGAPVQITGSAITAAQSFIDTICFPGINYTVASYISDKFFTQLDVEYNGLYSGSIQNDITNAITAYLIGIDFNSVVRLSDLLVAIKAVPGVIDVQFINVQARDNGTAFGSGTDMVVNSTEVARTFQTIAGYIVLETTAGKTLSDYRNGVSGIKNLNLIPR